MAGYLLSAPIRTKCFTSRECGRMRGPNGALRASPEAFALRMCLRQKRVGELVGLRMLPAT